jgi:hypothetical protein
MWLPVWRTTTPTRIGSSRRPSTRTRPTSSLTCTSYTSTGGWGNFQQFEDFQEAVCQVEQKSLFNKLQALALGNKYVLHDIYGPGFQIYLSGSVAYVAQCLPVEARIYDPVNCTQEIPAEI